MSEREQFEAWGGDQGYPLRRIHDEADQQYLDLRTQGAWEAWQAARAQPAQAGQVLSDEDVLRAAARTLDSEVVEVSPLSCIKDFARAIEQAERSKLGAGLGWQSIRTAPKDGTHILAVLPDRDTCYVICWVDAAKKIRSYLSVGTAAGWHHAYDGDPIAPHDHPTHWQPLPPPPGIVGKEGA